MAKTNRKESRKIYEGYKKRQRLWNTIFIVFFAVIGIGSAVLNGTMELDPQIVIGNKCDLATEEQIEDFRKYVESKGLTFVPISAATMQGVKELPGLVYNRLKDIPPVPVFAPEYKKPEPKANDRAFEIKRMEAHVWSVEAPWLEYILAGSNVDDYESLQFFQRQLDESGILTALVDKGVQENDTILIGDYQFDYIF